MLIFNCKRRYYLIRDESIVSYIRVIFSSSSHRIDFLLFFIMDEDLTQIDAPKSTKFSMSTAQYTIHKSIHNIHLCIIMWSTVSINPFVKWSTLFEIQCTSARVLKDESPPWEFLTLTSLMQIKMLFCGFDFSSRATARFMSWFLVSSSWVNRLNTQITLPRSRKSTFQLNSISLESSVPILWYFFLLYFLTTNH